MRGAPDRLRCPRSGAPLTLRRAWPRDDNHLLCEYTTPEGAPVAGQWLADHDRLRAAARGTPGDIDLLADDGVLLQRGGADRRLPALRALAGAPDATLVVHRPERRAVVRREIDGRALYAKVVRPERVDELADRAAGAARQADGAFRVPTPTALDRTAGVLVCEALTGRSLFALDAAPEATDGWAAAGRALARLHDGLIAGVPAHRAGDEAALTDRWLRRAAGYGLLPTVDAAEPLAALREDPAAPVGLVHRDLHDKQLIHRPGAPIGMLDTDTLASGERALDVANLLVHLELRVHQRRLNAWSAAHLRHAFLDAYRPDPETGRRLAAYATASRLRLAAVYAFRPRWRTLARRLLVAALSPPA